jgi:hypothetical protein
MLRKPGKRKSENPAIYYYKPSRSLENYVRDYLQFKKQEASMDIAARRKTLNLFHRRKTHVIKKVVFPAMANLVYLFEKTNEDSNIQQDFDWILRDLLGMNTDPNVKPYGQHFGVNERPITFFRLLKSMLEVYPGNNNVDGRLLLCDLVQSLVRYKLDFAMQGMKYPPELNALMQNDLERARLWTRLCSKECKEDFRAPARHTMFPPEEARKYFIQKVDSS